MFQAAIAIAHRHHEKNIALQISRFAEEGELVFADALHIGDQALQVGVVPPSDCDFVRHTAHSKARVSEGAHLHRVVDQLVVVQGVVVAKAKCPGAFAAREGRGNLPIVVVIRW